MRGVLDSELKDSISFSNAYLQFLYFKAKKNAIV